MPPCWGSNLRPAHDGLSAPTFVLTGTARASDVPSGAFMVDNRTPWERDEAEELWRIVEPVLTAWANDEVPLEEYAAGSSGPSGAKAAAQPGADRKKGTAAGDDPRSG